MKELNIKKISNQKTKTDNSTENVLAQIEQLIPSLKQTTQLTQLTNDKFF